MIRSSTIAVIAGVLLSALSAGTARANAAAPYHRDPGAAGGAFIAEPTHLVVEHETLAIDCAERDEKRECRFQAVYDVANPTDTAEEVLGVFFGASPDAMTIAAGGVDVRHALSPEQVAEALRSIVQREKHEPGHHEGEDDRRLHESRVTGFVVRVEANGKARLTFSGPLEATYTYHGNDGYAFPAIQTRHPLVGTKLRHAERIEFTYLIAPILTWSGQPSIDVTVRSPSSWSFSSAEQGWVRGSEDGRDVSKLATTAERTPRLTYAFDIAPPLVVNGGPLVGIGPELEEAGPRYRVGYEVGVSDWTIASLVYESFSDLHRSNYTFVPAIEAATPNVLFIIPSLSGGLGVPVQFHSSGGAFVGVRATVGIAFPLFSLHLPVDVYFSGTPSAKVALMSQLSF